MNRSLRWILVLAVGCLGLPVGAANVDVPDVGIDQRIGSVLPLNRAFRSDESGEARPLGDWFRSGRPAVLVLGYYECPQLCSVVMNGLVASLSDMKPEVGRDFDVFFVSIDPDEGLELAASKKRNYVRRYGKPESRDGWHFLTGSEASVEALAEAVGFRYRHDPELKQFAHASGLMVVTPTGEVSRYFYGIEFPPGELAAALRAAGEGKRGTAVGELLLLCYHYNPINGRYGLIIWRTLQAGALVTLGGLGAFVLRNLKTTRPHRPGKGDR